MSGLFSTGVAIVDKLLALGVANPEAMARLLDEHGLTDQKLQAELDQIIIKDPKQPDPTEGE